MTTKDRENVIHEAGRNLAKKLKGFFGSVKLNIQNGKYVNANVEQSMKPENQE